MAERVCECGCGEAMNPDSRWKFKRGHRPATPPGAGSAALARREAELVIEAPGAAEDDALAMEYVTCDISVAQLERIFGMLSAHQKAMAVLTGLEAED